MARPVPAPDVPMVDLSTGKITQVWHEYFTQHQKLSQFPDVSTTAPTNGQVLVWNDTTKLWTPGAN